MKCRHLNKQGYPTVKQKDDGTVYCSTCHQTLTEAELKEMERIALNRTKESLQRVAAKIFD